MSLEKFYFYVNFLGGLNSHQTFEKTFIRVHIDESLVNPHLPPVPGMGSFTAWTLSGWDPQSFRWEGDWSSEFHTCAVGDLHDLAANAVQALGVGA